jgi:membrane protein YqaA with SNARE-associated domain
VLIGAIAWIFYFVASFIWHFLVSVDRPLLIAVLAASATVLAATITVVIGRIFERKRETKSHFRQRKYDQYDEMVKLLYSFLSRGRCRKTNYRTR